MSMKNRVIWREGLFIKPQHFQQQQRNTEHQLHQRIRATGSYFYGLTSLTINQEYLNFGRVAITEASGVMPDGTVFSIPVNDLLPEPLIVRHSDGKSGDILLAIPMEGNNSVTEISQQGQQQGKSRLLPQHVDVHDLHTEGGGVVSVETAGMHIMLMRGSTDQRVYSTLPVARIYDILPDGKIILDDKFLPCAVNVAVMPLLKSFLGGLVSSVQERAISLAERISTPGQKGVADVSDFLLLQLLNRMYPQLKHFNALNTLHPERLYEALVQFCGELMTFVGTPRRPKEIPAYNHEHPGECFPELMGHLRQAMSAVLIQRAEPISLSQPQYGIRVAVVNDSELLKQADFVLAVRTSLPDETLIAQFPQQTKIASSEKIRELINLQLPGIPLVHLTSIPRQLPYHDGYHYFRLQKASRDAFIVSNSLAFHISGEFPDLDLQLWAIRVP